MISKKEVQAQPKNTPEVEIYYTHKLENGDNAEVILGKGINFLKALEYARCNPALFPTMLFLEMVRVNGEPVEIECMEEMSMLDITTLFKSIAFQMVYDWHEIFMHPDQ